MRELAARRLPVHRGHQRARGRAADRTGPLRRGDYRPGDERRRRTGDSGQSQGNPGRCRSDTDHGTRQHPVGRQRHAAGSVQLSTQAPRSGPIAGRGRSGFGQPAVAATECRAAKPTGRTLWFRGGDRHQRPDARRHRPAEADRSDRRHGTDPGGDGDRQGAGGPGDPSKQPAQEQAVRGVELRGLERKHSGERVVRPRAGRVYRRLDRPDRQVRICQRRDAFFGRSGRHAAGDANQTAARAGKWRNHARRLK